MKHHAFTCAVAVVSVLDATAVRADVTVGRAATRGMSCSAGVCAPIAKDAVLNVEDLENLLAAGDVAVTTTGSNVEAGGMRVAAGLSWSNASTLTLAAKGFVTVSAPISSQSGGLTVSSSDQIADGPFRFTAEGNIAFAELSSKLVINGAAYELVDSIDILARALAQNSSGNFALAADFDAGKGKAFTSTPIASAVAGNIEGLGNAITNIRIAANAVQSVGGLFSTIAPSGAVRNLKISALQMRVGAYQQGDLQTAGGLANFNQGILFGDSVSGRMSVNATSSGYGSYVGGIAAENTGSVKYCSASADLITKQTFAGGLVGSNSGVVSYSFATGKTVSLSRVPILEVGGLVAVNAGTIGDAYATGDVRASGVLEDEHAPTAGGLIGTSTGPVTASYSTGRVKLKEGYTGGFAGSISQCEDCYWDTTTSRMTRGAGEGAQADLQGETSRQLRSRLPHGFHKSDWSESGHINRGLPYLKNNTPPQ